MRRRRALVRRNGQREHGVLHDEAAFPQQLPAQLQGRPLLVRSKDGGAAVGHVDGERRAADADHGAQARLTELAVVCSTIAAACLAAA
mgnify:CR=1 FL=1